MNYSDSQMGIATQIAYFNNAVEVSVDSLK